MITRKKTGVIGKILSLRDPWRFQPGAKLYVRGWSQDQPVTVKSRATMDDLRQMVPHYHCLDCQGGTWLLSQLCLSTNPILERK